MRQIVNLSLPPTLVKQIKQVAKEEKYENLSEFMRTLINSYLSDLELIDDIKASETDYKQGKYREIKKMSELL